MDQVQTNSRRQRVSPVITVFEGDEVTSLICIEVSEHIKLMMKTFVVGSMVKVKCRLGFSLKDSRLYLTAEEIELISTVNLNLAND